jgi:hypothetical protein
LGLRHHLLFFGFILEQKFSRFFLKIFSILPPVSGLVEKLFEKGRLGISDVKKFLYIYPEL